MILECSAELLDGVLRCALGHFKRPRKPLSLDGVELSAQRGFVRGLDVFRIGLVRLGQRLPLIQRPVVGKAGRAAGLGKVFPLFGRGVLDLRSEAQIPGLHGGGSFLRHDQPSASATAFFMPSRSFLFFLLRDP